MDGAFHKISSDLRSALIAATTWGIFTSGSLAQTAPISYSPAGGTPLLTVAVTEVCSGIVFYDINGDQRTGTKSCSAGADCTGNNQTGCVTTAIYKSVDFTNMLSGNIKSGVTVAGIAGQYPSADYTLSGATSVADLDFATFDAKIKSSTAFEWFGPDGVRYSGAGDADLSVGENIANGVTLFGMTGTLVSGGNQPAPNPWDLRAGTVVSGVTGKLKVNCRNAADLTRFDIDAGKNATVTVASPGVFNVTAHGLANGTPVHLFYSTLPGGFISGTTYFVVNAASNSFQLSATSGGTGINATSTGASVTVHKWMATPSVVDIWDTVEDSSGFPTSTGFPSSWSVANNYCGNIETVAGDDNVWKDVTTTNGTTPSNCTTTPANCTMQDKISGLKWTKYIAGGSWYKAIVSCSLSTHNGQAAGSWRSPTEKEFLDAYNHGINGAISTNWISSRNTYLYTATSKYGAADSSAWYMNFGAGSTNFPISKGTSYSTVCVQ